MVINHTDCGLMHTSEEDLRTRIQNRAGTAAVAPAFFYAFQNIDENVRHQLQKLRTHPWIPKRRRPRLRLRRHQRPPARNHGLKGWGKSPGSRPSERNALCAPRAMPRGEVSASRAEA